MQAGLVSRDRSSASLFLRISLITNGSRAHRRGGAVVGSAFVRCLRHAAVQAARWRRACRFI